MDSLLPRDSDTCTGGKQWYVCAVGNFRGCCSSDPCTSGICPDDDASSTNTSRPPDTLSITKSGSVNRFPDVTVRTAASTTTTLTEATTVSSTTPSTTSSTIAWITASASPALSKSTSTSTSKVTALSSVLAATATHQTSSPSSPPTNIPVAGSNLGAIIGGVVGGVAALSLLAILIFCCIRRRRKQSKHEKQPTATSWYPHARKSRKARSEMKGAISPSSTDNTHTSVLLTPNIALGSPTTLISHPLHKISTPLSNELYTSIPPHQGLTPELPDTGFYRLRAELASHSQSELINVPIDERRRRQTPIKTRLGPRAWQTPTLAPIAGSPRASPVRESRNGHCRSHSAHASSNPTVVTSDGVVLGANLDRYSNGLEIARSLTAEKGTAERDADHVMSFMQYGGRSEVNALGTGDRPLEAACSVERPPPADNMDDVESDVPPAYEAEERLAGPEIKSPSGRMGLSLRGV